MRHFGSEYFYIYGLGKSQVMRGDECSVNGPQEHAERRHVPTMVKILEVEKTILLYLWLTAKLVAIKNSSPHTFYPDLRGVAWAWECEPFYDMFTKSLLFV